MQRLKTVICLKINYWQYEGIKSEILIPYISDFEKHFKDAHTHSVQNGCDTFPNELMRFRFEAKPIWEKIQTLCKNASIMMFANLCLINDKNNLDVF